MRLALHFLKMLFPNTRKITLLSEAADLVHSNLFFFFCGTGV
jgi:hypothetical protein